MTKLIGYLQIYVSLEDRELLRHLAKQEDISVSTLIREHMQKTGLIPRPIRIERPKRAKIG